MDDFLSDLLMLEDYFNKKSTVFIREIKNTQNEWLIYNNHLEDVNSYYTHLRNLLLKHDPDIYLLLSSDSSTVRRLALKIIWEGAIDLSLQTECIKKLIVISITGNDEEMHVARKLLIKKGLLKNHHEMVGDVIMNLLQGSVDYYLYKDIGDFLYEIKNHDFLEYHVTFGQNLINTELDDLPDLFAEKLETLDCELHP